MSAVNDSVDLLVHFFIKELEHTWRVKFADCKEFVNKNGVDYKQSKWLPLNFYDTNRRKGVNHQSKRTNFNN